MSHQGKIVRSGDFKFLLSPSFDCDRRKHGWGLVHDSRVKKGYFVPKLKGALKAKESYIVAMDLLKRVSRLKNRGGQRHAESMIRNQNMIPEGFKKHILLFPETIWRDLNGYFLIPYISHNNFGWFLNFYWMDLTFNRMHKIICG